MKRTLLFALALGLAVSWAAWAALPPVRNGEIPLPERSRPTLSSSGRWLAVWPLLKGTPELIESGPVSIWDVDQPRLAAQLLTAADRMLSAGFSPDERWFAATLPDELRLIDWRTGKTEHRVPLRMKGEKGHRAYFRIAPDGRHVAIQESTGGDYASYRSETTLYRLPEGTEVFRHGEGHLHAFSPDGKKFAYFNDYQKNLRPNFFRTIEESEQQQRGVHVVDLATMGDRWLRSDPKLYDGLHYRGEKNGVSLFFVDAESIVHCGLFSDLNRPGQRGTEFVEIWRASDPERPIYARETNKGWETRKASPHVSVEGNEVIIAAAEKTWRVNWRTGQETESGSLWRPPYGDIFVARLPTDQCLVLSPEGAAPFYEEWLRRIRIDLRGKNRSPVMLRFVDEKTGKTGESIPNVWRHGIFTDQAKSRLFLRRGDPEQSKQPLEIWSLPPRRNWPVICGLGALAAALAFGGARWMRRKSPSAPSEPGAPAAGGINSTSFP